MGLSIVAPPGRGKDITPCGAQTIMQKQHSKHISVPYKYIKHAVSIDLYRLSLYTNLTMNSETSEHTPTPTHRPPPIGFSPAILVVSGPPGRDGHGGAGGSHARTSGGSLRTHRRSPARSEPEGAAVELGLCEGRTRDFGCSGTKPSLKAKGGEHRGLLRSVLEMSIQTAARCRRRTKPGGT